MRHRVMALAALTAAVAAFGTTNASADPYDAQLAGRPVSTSFVFAPLFLPGEVDVSLLGASEAELATAGPTASARPADGPGILIVDDDGADCPNAGYTSIQAAVTASGNGARIRVCPGTYAEQVDVGPGHDGLTLFSEQPRRAVIKAPLVMSDPGDIVRVHGARDVTLSRFTIAGPLPDSLFCSLQTRTGVRIDEGGSATLRDNVITEIRSTSPALRGCQNGIGVLVGRQSAAQVGTATITHNRIELYQKGAIVVDNAGSYAQIDHNQIVHGPPDAIPIAPNGVQVSRGAGAKVQNNVVTENTGAALGTGILVFQAGTGLVAIEHNKVYRNDDGISLYETDEATVSHNDSFDQLVYDGIYADAASERNTISYNDTYRNAEHDCHDDSNGTGTAGTANTWSKNKGTTQNRPGLCKSTG